MTPCGALRASPHHQQRNDSTHLSLIIFFHCFFHCFLRFRCGDAFCTDTLLQTDDEQKPLHRAAFMRRYSYTERFARRLTFTRRRLYTQRLSRNEMFTQQFLHTDVLHRDVFAHINKGTQALLHTEPFIERNLCTEQLLHKKKITLENFDPEKIVHTDCTKKNTHRNFHTQTFYPEQLLHTFFSAQKPLRTEVFLHSSFYTDAFTHRCLYTETLLHTKNCAHSTLFYTQPVFTRRCFASPAWSPTFRVPPLKYYYIYILYYAWMPVIPSKIGFEPNPERKGNVSKISLVTNQHTAICI